MALGLGNCYGICHNKFDWKRYWTSRYPSGFQSTPFSSTRNDLTWTNNGTADYDGISIERSTDGVTYAQIITVAVGSTTYSNTGLTTNTLYFYRIKYYKGTHYSVYSNIDAAVTVEVITDADGNVYTKITIGTQYILLENLKTTKYNDGSAIPTGLSNANWALEDGTVGHDGAFAQVNNDAGNKAAYGLLYNFYAVINAKGIAPPGYLIISDTDYTALVTVAGGSAPVGGVHATAGKHIKEAGTVHWTAPHAAGMADNSTLFTGIGAGYRDQAGAYALFKEYNLLWSNTVVNAINADDLQVTRTTTVSEQVSQLKKLGLSVRCRENRLRFKDNFLENICSASSTAYGEPTALVSDDGNQIDLWFDGTVGVNNCIHYTYSTDGLTFAAPVPTDIPTGYLRNHILKYNGVYYYYASVTDNSIHLFTSTDKINFTDQGEVLHHGGVGTWDSQNVANTFVWHEGSNWFMLYDGQDGGAAGWQTGLATASAPEGLWTKYGVAPVIPETATLHGAWQPEMPRVNNEVIKHNGRYYLYYCNGLIGAIKRAYSTDLHNWTLEGAIVDIRTIHGGMVSYGDECLVEFKGKSYLFINPTNQVNLAHIDIGIDNRPLIAMLALTP